MIDILYEDTHLIVCVKPKGILSQPDLSGNKDILSLLADYFKDKKEKCEVGLVHRLDQGVGGVMVFGKKAQITSKLAAAIAEKNVIKEYFAVVHNSPEDQSGIYKDLLFKDSSKNKSFVVDRLRKGVKEASLEYFCKESKDTPSGFFSLVKVRLHTGRTHQIRVQFSSRKMPLVGDGKYGSKVNCEIALWSYRLAFWHPVKKEYIDIVKNPDTTFPFDMFSQESF